jgi:natural product biosynthesis luciferase-like monooxygenase protein
VGNNTSNLKFANSRSYFAVGKLGVKQLFIKNSLVKIDGVFQEGDPALFCKLSSDRFKIKSPSLEFLTAASTDSVPVISKEQKEYWLLQKILGEKVNLNTTLVFEINGELDKQLLRDAFVAVLEKHVVLRTVYADRINNIEGRVISPRSFSIELEPRVTHDNESPQCHHIIKGENARLIDTANDFMLRAKLLQQGDKHHLLIMTAHNMATDMWSLSLIVNEILEFYSSSAGPYGYTSDNNFPYSAYAKWIESADSCKFAINEPKLYLDRLCNPALGSALVGLVPELAMDGCNKVSIDTDIDVPTFNSFESIFVGSDVSPFVGMCGLFLLALSRLTGNEKIKIAIPNPNRYWYEFSNSIGSYETTTIFEVNVGQQLNFENFLSSLNRQLPGFNENAGHDSGFAADVAFDVQDFRQFSHIECGNNLTLSFVKMIKSGGAQNLSLRLVLRDESITAEWIYNPEIYKENFVQALSESFDNYLLSVVGSGFTYGVAENPVSPLPQTELPVSQHNIYHFFSDCVKKYPSKTALLCDSRNISYVDLLAASNAIAENINRIAGDTKALIAIASSAADVTVSALLGVLKTGASYINVDPLLIDDSYLRWMKEIGVKVILSDSLKNSALHSQSTIDVILLDEFSCLSEINADKAVPPTNTPNDVIAFFNLDDEKKHSYVSNSTAIDTIETICEHYSLSGNDKFLSFSKLNSELFLFDLFATFKAGACLVVANEGLPAHQWMTYVNDNQISVFNATDKDIQDLTSASSAAIGAVSQSLRLLLLSSDFSASKYYRYLTSLFPNADFLELRHGNPGEIWRLVVPVSNAHVHSGVQRYNKPLYPKNVILKNEDENISPAGVWGNFYDAREINVSAGKLPAVNIFKRTSPVRQNHLSQKGRLMDDGTFELVDSAADVIGFRNNSINRKNIEDIIRTHPDVETAKVSVVVGDDAKQYLVADVVTKEAKAHNPTDDKIGFSLFYFGTESSKVTDRYDLYLKSAIYADNNNFEALWTPERHFGVVGALYPTPALLNAALATVTKQIKLRAGSVVLPLQHPVRIAEEWSVVDNLSNGRIGLGVASGFHPRDFVVAPENFSNRRDVTAESLNVIYDLWSGKRISEKDGNQANTEIEIFPKPIQQKLPVWLTTAGSPDAFREAGRQGVNVLTHMLGQPIGDLKEKVAIYREALAAAGHDAEKGRVTVMIHTFLGENIDETLNKARAPFSAYIREHASLILRLLKNPKVSVEDVDEKTLAGMADFAFDHYVQKGALIGTPESVAHIVHDLADAGVNEVACLVDWMDDESVLNGLSSLNRLKNLINDKNKSLNLSDYCNEFLPASSLPAQFRYSKSSSYAVVTNAANAPLPPQKFEIPYFSPRTDTEKYMFEVWRKYIPREKISIHDNFFALGGKAIDAFFMLKKINESIGINIPFYYLIEYGSLEALGAYIDAFKLNSTNAAITHEEIIEEGIF